jgi:putative inorganic carbon (HCO3(-)) transporter
VTLGRGGLRLALVPVAAFLAFVALQASVQATPADAFERAILLVAGGGVLVAAVVLPPAWPLSAALVLSLFSSHWDQLGSSVDFGRILLGIGVLSVIVRERRHGDGRLQTRPVDWLLALTGIYALLSAWVAGTLSDVGARFELIDTYGLIPFAVFFAAPFAFRTERERRVLLGAIVLIGVYLGVDAVLERTGARSLVVPSYINDKNIGIHYDRARGPFLDGGANGIALYACGVGAVVAFGRWRSRRWRAFALFVAGLCLVGVILALTRAAWLGAIVASPLALLAARETRRFVVPAAIACVGLVLGALAAIPGLQQEVDKRQGDKPPIWDRRNSNAAALRMIAARPLIGFGWGRFGRDGPAYFRQSQDYPLTIVNDLHNVYLSRAVALGLIGGILWLVALLTAVGGAIMRRGPPELRAWKLGLIAVAGSLFVVWVTTPAGFALPTLLLWMWAGVAWGGRDQSAAV